MTYVYMFNLPCFSIPKVFLGHCVFLLPRKVFQNHSYVEVVMSWVARLEQSDLTPALDQIYWLFGFVTDRTLKHKDHSNTDMVTKCYNKDCYEIFSSIYIYIYIYWNQQSPKNGPPKCTKLLSHQTTSSGRDVDRRLRRDVAARRGQVQRDGDPLVLGGVVSPQKIQPHLCGFTPKNRLKPSTEKHGRTFKPNFFIFFCWGCWCSTFFVLWTTGGWVFVWR